MKEGSLEPFCGQGGLWTHFGNFEHKCFGFRISITCRCMYLRQNDTMKEARVTDTDFHQTARMSNSGVIKLWQFICQSSKGRVIDSTIMPKRSAHRFASCRFPQPGSTIAARGDYWLLVLLIRGIESQSKTKPCRPANLFLVNARSPYGVVN